jgi:hypothetical protein
MSAISFCHVKAFYLVYILILWFVNVYILSQNVNQMLVG